MSRNSWPRPSPATTILLVVQSVSQPRPGVDLAVVGDAELDVLLDEGVENGVGNLVGNLVRMTLGHGFAGEEKLARDTVAHS
jgi:hypothetical protein